MTLTKPALLAFTVALCSVGTTARAADAATTPEKKIWDNTASLGLTLTRGNSKTLMINGVVQSVGKWDKNEVNLGADGTYGENEVVTDGVSKNVKNAESIRGYGQFNRLFTDRAFAYVRLEVLHDDIADVDYRITFSPGAGYYLIKKPDSNLRVEVGPGYIYESQGGENDDYFTLRLAERYDQKLNDRAKLWQSIEYLPQVDDFNNYIINGEIGVDIAITKKLSQRTYLQDTFHSRPAAGRQKNDLKLVAAIAYKF